MTVLAEAVHAPGVPLRLSLAILRQGRYVPYQMRGAGRSLRNRSQFLLHVAATLPTPRPGALLALLLLLCLGLWGCQASAPDAPTPNRGAVDLSAWDAAQGPLALDGEWEVRWGALLEPGDFAAPDAPAPDYAQLPAPWSRSMPGADLFRATGEATYRIVLRCKPGAEHLALRLSNVNAAWRLWAAGRLVAQSGTPGPDAATEQPRPSVAVVPLPPHLPEQGANQGADQDGAMPLELVLQVSNHNFREGGVLSTPVIGPESLLLAQQQHDAGVALAIAGALLVMGVYHAALYFFRRNNVSPLLFAAYCLLWLCNYAGSDSSGWAARILIPALPPSGLERIALAGLFLSVPVGFTFFRSLYPQEFSRRVQSGTWAMGAAFTALAALGSPLATSTVLPLYYLISSSLILYCFLRLHRARRHGRSGATFIFAGFLLLGLVALHDMLTDLRLVNSTPMLAPGLLLFIMSQAFALSQRLSQAFSSVETLSGQLEHKNLVLEAEMAERNRLEREIINISEEERRRMSVDLHDGVCQLLTAARLRCAVLSNMPRTSGESAELAKLSSLLEELVDQAYDLSHGLWPLEHGAGSTGPSLGDMIRRFSLSSGVPIDLALERACESCPSANVTQLYRIAQEALTNAVKHAKPRRINVRFTCRAGGDASLTVRDDGIGRARAAGSKGGLGMGIMAHRARMIGGDLSIRDGREGGTVVRCSVPCEITVPTFRTEGRS